MNIPAILLESVCFRLEHENGKELSFYERGIKIDRLLIGATLCALNNSPTKTLPQNCRNDICERTPDGLDRRIKEQLGSDLRTANIISDLLAGAGIVEVTQVQNPETGRLIKGTRLLDQWCWDSEAEDAEWPGFKEAAEDISDQIISWRRDLHRIPEKGYELNRTSKYLGDQLDKLKVPYQACAGTGLVGLIEGALPGPVIGLRADMDGLAIKEETGLPYASETGCMHACGHDAHMAMLLGAAKMIMEYRQCLRGKVKLLFQPAEEEGGGAEKMIREGCLEHPPVDAVLGLHIGQLISELEPGQVGIGYGPVMAGVTAFELTVRGKSAHICTPHQGVDAITTASEMVLALQKIVSRELDPLRPATLGVSFFEGGEAFNALAGKVVFKGDFRTVDKRDEQFMKRRIEEVCKAVAGANRAEVTVDFIGSFPATVNDEVIVDQLIKSARKVLLPEEIVEIKKPAMGNDDMACFLEKVPGAYFFLGSKHPEFGDQFPHHHPRFDIDEAVLWKGAAVLARATVDFGDKFGK